MECVGRYRIVRTLGEGGMGVVYAAEDPRLGREVALKRIQPASKDPAARERLWREARAGASITHPNVCQIYDVIEEGDELYVAMELLEGEPLSARLGRGALPLQEALDVALGVLSALTALHARGMIHRDLKPSNVFLTPHGIKLLDFGLAAPFSVDMKASGDRLTATGLILGTPGFMAPEQWTGEPVGPSADLFAVGALLFEMATGGPAFSGKNAIEVFHAVAYTEVPALTGGAGAAAADRILQRALAKRPEERFATAAEMAQEVRAAKALAHDTAAPRVRALTRLVVLPFRMLRPDPETDFLALALPDAIATSLSGLDSVVVRSPHAAARFGGASPDLQALADGAEVEAALMGTIMRGGDRLRVTVQLLEAPAGTVLWSDTAQVSLGDLFHLQDELAHGIVRSLKIPLGTGEEEAFQKDVPASPQAYEAYLKANQLALRHSDMIRARDLYEACLREDPAYAPAWARLGRVHRVLAKYGYADKEASLQQAKEAFRRALEINPDLSAAHNLFTYFEVEELRRPQEAMRRLLTRSAEHTADPELFAGLVLACRFCGLLEASRAADQRARRLDPTIRTSAPYTLWMLGEYEEAMRREDDDMRWVRIYALPFLDRTAEAILEARALEARDLSETARHMVVTVRATLEGQREEAIEAGRGFLASGFHDPEGLLFGARAMAKSGAQDLSLEFLERVASGGLCCPQVLRQDPWFDAVRDRREFAAHLEKMEAGRRDAARAYDEAGGPGLLGAGDG